MSRSLFFLWAVVSAFAADSQRGAMVLENAGCLECHTVRGQGIGHEANATAPELGSGLVPAYTAPALASAVWNHTPSMLADMFERGVNRPALTTKDSEDLFAYLYTVQFFDFPAEVRRGKEVFQSKQCASCHSLEKSSSGPGKAVPEWTPVDDPVTLVYQMWNHASAMHEEWAGPGWNKMSGRDFGDLTVYLQESQGGFRQSSFTLPDPASGQAPFDQHCGRCHAGPLALENRLSNLTSMDIAAGMWNHVPLMHKLPALPEEDMRKILAYVWQLQYRGAAGDAARGWQTFSQKGCASCHGDRGAGSAVTPFSLAAIGWGEGRRMHQRMVKQGVPWPQLSPEDVADVVAYLNSGR